MNNQYNQNDLNNNMNNNLTTQQPMNNQQINPAMQGFQQPVQQPKKKKIALTVVLSIVGIIVLAIVSLVVTLSIEEKQDKPWKSGQVEILGKNIQLPCDVDTFESTLNTTIRDNEASDVIKKVKIKLDYKSTLKFDVYVENDLVVGVMVDAKDSNHFSLMDYNDRDIAKKIVYPGNVTVETSIDKIKELYNTKPFNSSYTYYEEEIGLEPPHQTSANHQYQNSEWSIEIHTIDGEITGISYYYLKD